MILFLVHCHPFLKSYNIEYLLNFGNDDVVWGKLLKSLFGDVHRKYTCLSKISIRGKDYVGRPEWDKSIMR